MGRPRIEGICSTKDCQNSIYSKGFCQYHYNRHRLNNDPEKAKAGLRGHPLYHLWFERKQANLLCWEWTHFPYFIDGVSPKPEGEYFLVRLDATKSFSPDNFLWQLHLKRQDGESKKDWWARKRAARVLANPSMDRERNYKRFFGITIEIYEQKFKNQNGKCAICSDEETSVDGKTGSIRRLAIDHCHKSKGIRELLCWRCNSTLGNVNDDIKLLHEMINYLIKHKETD